MADIGKNNENYYDILNIPRDANNAEIKSAYKFLVSKFHPDLNKDANASDRFKKIVRAYTVLKDSDLRPQYDRAIGNGLFFVPKIKLGELIKGITRSRDSILTFVKIFFKNVAGKTVLRSLKEYNDVSGMEFDTVSIPEELISMSFNELSQRLVYSSNVFVKANALLALGMKGERQSFSVISQHVFSENPMICKSAVWALSKLRMRTATEVLKKLYITTQDSDLKITIVKSIFRLEPSDSYELYSMLVKSINDTDESVRVAALNILNETGKKVVYSDIKDVFGTGMSDFGQGVLNRLIAQNRIINYYGR